MKGPSLDIYGANKIAFESRDEEVLLAGPAGTGKTATWLAKCWTVCQNYSGARVLVVRKTRESLTETVLVTFERDILGPGSIVLARNPILRRVRQSYHHPNGSVVVLGGLDKPDKTLSSEYDLVYVPEATDLTLVDWETLGRSLRAGRVPYQQIVADCNPTTPHHWLYQRCQPPGSGRCRLIRSRHEDNPRYFDQEMREWTPAGRAYIQGRLERMTGASVLSCKFVYKYPRPSGGSDRRSRSIGTAWDRRCARPSTLRS
ncbi:MAG: phage terminase large subunit, partial [Gemmataceae bacterium]|nr:phage terminase large subunit [Gemmataceae bacterium]